MDKRDGHNTQNGEIVFIKTQSIGTSGSFADQPTPSTTKVSIKDDCPNLPGIYQMYLNEKKRIEDEKTAEKKAAAKEAREKKKQEPAAEKKKNQPAGAVAGGGVAAALPADEQPPKVVRRRRSVSPKMPDQQLQPQQVQPVAVEESVAAGPSMSPRQSTAVVSTTSKKTVLRDEEILAIAQMASKYNMQSSGEFEQFKAELKAKFGGDI
jgi:hypothetical protein